MLSQYEVRYLVIRASLNSVEHFFRVSEHSGNASRKNLEGRDTIRQVKIPTSEFSMQVIKASYSKRKVDEFFFKDDSRIKTK